MLSSFLRTNQYYDMEQSLWSKISLVIYIFYLVKSNIYKRSTPCSPPGARLSASLILCTRSLSTPPPAVMGCCPISVAVLDEVSGHWQTKCHTCNNAANPTCGIKVDRKLTNSDLSLQKVWSYGFIKVTCV